MEANVFKMVYLLIIYDQSIYGTYVYIDFIE